MTRTAIGALVFLLAACPPGEPEPGRYQCNPALGEQTPAALEQCPGQFRCGLERFCHAVGDTSTAWLCKTSANCEGGFACGVDGTCYDRAQPKAHPCGTPPSDAYCSPGWRCGLEGTCHDTLVARDYLCAADSDCELPWRCGLEGRCLDPSNDSLRSQPFSAGLAEAMSPLYLQRQPTMLAVSEPFGPTRDQQSIAFVDQGRLVYLERKLGEVPLGTRPIGVIVDAGPINSPFAIAAVARRVFASSPAGLYEYGFDAGSVQVEPAEPPFCNYNYQRVPHQHLRNLAGIQGVIAFSDSPDAGYSVLVPTACNVNLPFEFLGGSTSTRINDMAALLAPKKDGGGHPDDECYFLADSRGLWLADYDNVTGAEDFPFVPIDNPLFPNQACGVTSEQETLGLKITGEFLVTRSRPRDGGVTDHVSIASLTTLLNGGTYPCFEPYPCRSHPLYNQGLPIEPVFGPCPVCQGTEVLSFFAVSDLPRTIPAIEVRCLSVPDAGLPQQSFLVRSGLFGACSSTLLPGIGTLLSDEVIASIPSQAGVAYAGTRGQIWTGTSSEDAPPLTLDRPAESVAQMHLRGESTGRALAISAGYLAMHSPGVGYVGFSPVRPDRIVASVDGVPNLAITNRKAVLRLDDLDPGAGPRTIAFSQDSSRFDPPFTAAATLVSGTGAHLFIAADERIFTAEVTWASATPAALKNRGAAVPGLQVGSLVAVPAGPAGLSAAWILSGQRLVYVVSGATSWQRQELQVPVVAGAFPMEVWADGARGRLGYTDGSVFSLPSRVQIGSRLPTLQQRVVDFASACGKAFALAPEGLFRLGGQAGDTVGKWDPVPTGAIGDGGFEGGRVHALGSELHLFTAFGESARLPIGPCP